MFKNIKISTVAHPGDTCRLGEQGDDKNVRTTSAEEIMLVCALFIFLSGDPFLCDLFPFVFYMKISACILSH